MSTEPSIGRESKIQTLRTPRGHHLREDKPKTTLVPKSKTTTFIKNRLTLSMAISLTMLVAALKFTNPIWVPSDPTMALAIHIHIVQTILIVGVLIYGFTNFLNNLYIYLSLANSKNGMKFYDESCAEIYELAKDGTIAEDFSYSDYLKTL